MVTELMKDVYWVGIVDWGLRKFHGHELSTHRGSTYNSYLIRDEKTVLVDTTWAPFRRSGSRTSRPSSTRRRSTSSLPTTPSPITRAGFPSSCSMRPTPS